MRTPKIPSIAWVESSEGIAAAVARAISAVVGGRLMTMEEAMIYTEFIYLGPLLLCSIFFELLFLDPQAMSLKDRNIGLSGHVDNGMIAFLRTLLHHLDPLPSKIKVVMREFSTDGLDLVCNGLGLDDRSFLVKFCCV